MKIIRSRSASLFFFFVPLLGCALLACGGVELKPEHLALVDKYERLIDSYETKFAAAREDPSRLAKVTDSYAKDIELWGKEFEKIAPSLSDSEGLAIKASIEKLNGRVEKMFMGG